MADGIHFMALDGIRSRLAETEQEYQQASQQLDEALKMGDLRENAEYDMAKSTLSRVAMLRDELSPALTMAPVKSNDNVRVIEEGSIIELTVWSLTPNPLPTTSPRFQELKQGEPEFKGILMFGATLRIHELLTDKALATDTAVGRFIVGKQPGDYSVPVPGGFANITVEKLQSTTGREELYCEMRQG